MPACQPAAAAGPPVSAPGASAGRRRRSRDDLPLAIELVASRVRQLAPHALLTRLGHSLGLAAADTGRRSRQQTLRAAIGWSYDLLGPELAGVFRRTGVFAGDATLMR